MSLTFSGSTFPSAKWGKGVLPASFAEQMRPIIHPRVQEEGCLWSMWGSSCKTPTPCHPRKGVPPTPPPSPCQFGAVSSPLAVVLSVLFCIASRNLLLGDYFYISFCLWSLRAPRSAGGCGSPKQLLTQGQSSINAQ